MKATRIYALLVAMLLAGCQEGNPPRKKQTEAKNDSLEMDSIRKFYERMELWEALHEGMSMADK
jgi:hypothetical protein